MTTSARPHSRREASGAIGGPTGEAKVLDLIRDGTRRANLVAEETLYEAKKAMRLDFGARTLTPR